MTKESSYTKLVTQAQSCTRCPRMYGMKKVLSSKNGNIRARVLFVAEAPGRNGAERTGIPLYGDPAGYAFTRLLNATGWSRDTVFITNSVLCNPTKDGKNDKPTYTEICNCSSYLKRTIDLVSPRVVATLGSVALQATSLIENHGLLLASGVATPIEWYGRFIFPLYHTSPRVFIHRSEARQKQDFIKLREFVEVLNENETHRKVTNDSK